MQFTPVRLGDAGSPVMVLVTVCIAQFMVPFMLTAVGVALPSLGRDLGASAVQLGLVEQLYALALAMSMLACGRLGDIVGQRRVLLPGLAVFTGLTLLVGLAPSVELVMALRFGQGIGAAMMLSGSLALVAAAYPPELRGRVIGIVSAFTYAGLSIGPVLGGYTTDHFGWRSVFLMVVPPGLAATAMCLWRMRPQPGADKGAHMDWPGSLVYAVSVCMVMTGAARATSVPLGPVLMAAGLVGLVLFLKVEERSKSPLLDVNLLLRNRFFSLSCLAAFGNYAAVFGVTFLFSLFLQYAKGLPPREAGLILLIQPVMQVLTAPLSGRLSDRIDPGRVATAGMLFSAAGLLLAMATIAPGMPVWLLAAELVCIGIGFGIFVTANSVAIMSSVDKAHFGVASGMVGAMRTLGMACSMTAVSLIFALHLGEAAITPAVLPEFLSATRTGLAVAAVFSCLGVLVSVGRGRKQD